MKIGVYYVVSATAAAAIANDNNFPWLKKLSEETGFEFEVTDVEHINDYDMVVDFIGGGGTEGIFKRDMDKLPQPYLLLTTGANNSLAASMEILSYMIRGLTNRDISESLRISTDTVEEHVNLILAKLNAANRAEAVAIALKKQLLKA